MPGEVKVSEAKGSANGEVWVVSEAVKSKRES